MSHAHKVGHRSLAGLDTCACGATRIRGLVAWVADRRVYRPTYAPHAALGASDAAWLRANDGKVSRLADVTDMCATFHVCAVLLDLGGEVVGRVNAKGDFTPL